MNLLVSKPNQALVVPPHAGVDTMFPNAPLLPHGNGVKVIPHGLRETLMLRHLGFKVPNPMDLYYDYHGGTPYAVQRATCRMLVENPKSYVLNDMGTGKTKVALWAWDYLNRHGMAGKMLVVAPLSTLHFVWCGEVFDTLPGRVIKVLHGTKVERIRQLSENADIYVINHDGLKVVEGELAARTDIDTLVIDELAVYRNNSDRSKRMRKFARRFDKVWGMTGAPMPNEPTDVWSQCLIITPDTVPKYKSHARDMLMVRISNFNWRPKPDAVQRALSWMQPSCRYKLEDVVELPPVISRTVDVDMSDEQTRAYKSMVNDLSVKVKNKQVTAVNAGVEMSKLLQIAGGWLYTNNPEFVRLDPTPRITALVDLIQSNPEKVLVAFPYRHMLEGVSKIFDLLKIKHSVVHGDTPNRESIFGAFQSTDREQVMLLHPQCVAHGVTLTAASMVIWYLPIMSLDIYEQLNARITRIGQANKQQVIHLQATPNERKIYRMLREHQKVQNHFLQLVEEATNEGQSSI